MMMMSLLSFNHCHWIEKHSGTWTATIITTTTIPMKIKTILFVLCVKTKYFFFRYICVWVYLGWYVYMMYLCIIKFYAPAHIEQIYIYTKYTARSLALFLCKNTRDTKINRQQKLSVIKIFFIAILLQLYSVVKTKTKRKKTQQRQQTGSEDDEVLWIVYSVKWKSEAKSRVLVAAQLNTKRNSCAASNVRHIFMPFTPTKRRKNCGMLW